MTIVLAVTQHLAVEKGEQLNEMVKQYRKPRRANRVICSNNKQVSNIVIYLEISGSFLCWFLDSLPVELSLFCRL